MQELPRALQRYPWAIYVACVALVIGQVGPFVAPGATGAHVVLQDVAVFVLLAYAGERITLQVRGSVWQSLGTTVHIAVILLFHAVALARAMGLAATDIIRVRLAGLLHDVGKIGVPDAVLTKPGKLTDAEFAVIKQHPVIGEGMLAAVPFLHAILPAVRHHHEHWDGQGYPDGLAGTTIPQDATILMVADAFDAMTSSRTYRSALPMSEACRRVREGCGSQFDPRVVAAFEHTVAQGILTLLSPRGTGPLHPDHVARAS